MRAMLMLVLLPVWLMTTSCRQEPSKADCEKMSRHRVRLLFRGVKASIRKRAEPLELAATQEECLASWDAREVACVLAAQDRETAFTCRR